MKDEGIEEDGKTMECEDYFSPRQDYVEMLHRNLNEAGFDLSLEDVMRIVRVEWETICAYVRAMLSDAKEAAP